jgi:hypothetical protein
MGGLSGSAPIGCGKSKEKYAQSPFKEIDPFEQARLGDSCTDGLGSFGLVVPD